MKGYPKWFTSSIIVFVVGILFFSGLILTPTVIENQLQLDMPWRISASGRIGVAALHALFAFLTAILLGALWSIHMRAEWRKEANRWSAISMIFIFVLLLVTGIGIYYLGDSSLIFYSSLLHAAVGISLLIPFLWHVVIYKKLKSNS